MYRSGAWCLLARHSARRRQSGYRYSLQSRRHEVDAAVQKRVAGKKLHAAWIAGCTGSLTDVALRYAGQEGTTLLNGTFEVISLNGTLEQSGEHLHLCVSDPHGTMLGGHMMPGCTVRTTLELVIGSLEELAFSRQPCALSGYDELHISPVK